MVGRVVHIGITVSDIEKSIVFYRDIVGLTLKSRTQMYGKETDILFNKKDVRVKLAYLNGSSDSKTPDIELLEFDETTIDKADLTKTSISEVCFITDDIDKMYKHLLKNNVECLSPPQEFDFTKDGLGKSRAIYFKDPDGNILELMQYL